MIRLGLMGLLLLAAAGCKEDPAPPAADKGPLPEKVALPEAPANGSALVPEFLGMVGEGDRLGGRFRLFNVSDKPVEQVDLMLTYHDAQGREVGSDPFRARANPLIRPRGYLTAPLGGSVPAETVRIEARVLAVQRPDATWKHPSETPLGPTR